MRFRHKTTQLKVLSAREARILESLTDAYCAPEGGFPPVARTDAVAFIDDLSSRAPGRNRLGLHFLLVFVDLFPLVRGYRRRFCRLGRSDQSEFLRGLDKSRWSALAIPGKLLKLLTMMSYYGNGDSLRAAGYDSASKVARGRELRAQRSRS